MDKTKGGVKTREGCVDEGVRGEWWKINADNYNCTTIKYLKIKINLKSILWMNDSDVT